MTQHNITGWEPTGPHIIVRRAKRVHRRSLGDRILIGIGAFTVLASLLVGLSAVIS